MFSKFPSLLTVLFVYSVFRVTNPFEDSPETMKFATGTSNSVMCKSDVSLNSSSMTWYDHDMVAIGNNPASRVYQDNLTGLLTFSNLSLFNDSGLYTCLISCNDFDPADGGQSGTTDSASSEFGSSGNKLGSRRCSNFTVEIVIYDMPNYLKEVLILVLLNVFVGGLLLFCLVRSSILEMKRVKIYESM